MPSLPHPSAAAPTAARVGARREVPTMRSITRISLLTLSLPLALACGSEGGGSDPAPAPDAGSDALPEAAVDASPDVLPEAAPDAGPDVSPDVSPDVTPDVTPDTAPDAEPDVTPDVTPDAEPPPSIALFLASNYATTAEMIAVDLDHGSVLGNLLSDDQDSLVDAREGHAFLLRRTAGEVQVLNPAQPWLVDHTVDVAPEAGTANPWAVVVPAGNKAYVVRYGQNSLSIIDPAAGSLLGEIDLSSYVTDSDGLVDAFAGVFDPSTGRAYIGLQRVNQLDFGSPPDYVHACNDSHPAIVGIDTTDDSIVDLNGADPGEALEVESYNPWRMLWDDAAGRIVLLSVGCAVTEDGGTSTRARRGVEAVDPETGTTEWLWSTDGLDRPGDLVWISGTEAIVGLDDASFMRTWRAWDPSTSQLGATLTGVPDVPVWDGARGLVGLAFGSTSLDVVRYDLDEGTSAALIGNAFATTGVFATSSARVR